MRLEVTRRAELAVQAVATLSPRDTRLKAPELGEALDATPGFVAQVVGPLVKAGWVRSTPGPSGGYSLTDAAAGASVLDVIEAVDGPTATGRCVAQDRACATGDTCALHDAWTQARTTLTSTLAATPAVPVHLRGAG
ncbi:RrF2 family transcriptional regulator [Janibacter anophelis]|nr:Rrf2 family transcriptional regulator [Janibacter anophelis]